MSNFTMKTYKDSYLYNNKISNKEPSNPDKRTNEAIRDFITTSYRIEDIQRTFFDAFNYLVQMKKEYEGEPEKDNKNYIYGMYGK